MKHHSDLLRPFTVANHAPRAAALVTALLALSASANAGFDNPPVASTGGNSRVGYEVDCNNQFLGATAVTSVQLDGSGSYDPDGTPVTFYWHNECAWGSFDDPASPAPVYHVDMTGACERECWIALRVTSGGQTTIKDFRVIVADVTPPVLTAPADYLGIWGDSIAADNTGLAVAADNCDPAPMLWFHDVILPATGPGQPELTLQRTWSVVDCAKLQAHNVQMIRLLAPTGDVGERANLDFDPSQCPNEYVLSQTGNVEITLLGADSFRTEKVIPQTLRVMIRQAPGIWIVPSNVLLKDVGSIAATNYGDCNSGRMDGRKDLTLRFDRLNLSAQFELSRFSGQTVEVMVTGVMTNSKLFATRDFVRIQ